MARKGVKRSLKAKVATKLARAKKKPVVLKRVKKQTGISNTVRDKVRKALPPGYRVSKTGRIYYESRRNRSDLSKRRKL